MKEIRIIRLTLENFKCHERLELEFGGRDITVYGDNATGKTSIYDGLTCLLFGKDSSGRTVGEKGVNIKPLDANGEVKDHHAITAVEAELWVDGEVVTLRRTWQEVWTTRRGSGEAVYNGDTACYYIDAVPMKKNAFDAKVRQLVPEELFRMLTSVSYFASDMKWQERRGVLFDMAGTMTDREIMAKRAGFRSLAEGMGKRSLNDYKAKLLSQKKALTGLREDAPARMDECRRILQELEGIDFPRERAEEKRLLDLREELSGRLAAREQSGFLESRELELRELELERAALESKNRAYRDRQCSCVPDVGYLSRQLAQEQGRLQTLKTLCDKTLESIKHYDAEQKRSRDNWVQVNGEAFAGGICPACGQSLPFEQLKAATASFEEKKRQRLQDIENTASRLKEEREQTEQRLAQLEQEEAQRAEETARLRSAIRQAEAAAAAVTDMEGYRAALAQIDGKISSLRGQIADASGDSHRIRAAVREELDSVSHRLRSCQSILAKEAVKESTEKRIAQLLSDAKNAAEALEDIEKMLYLMEEFVRFKAGFLEGSVNDLFRLAAFRLFREQANGGLEERCDAMYGGVPFPGLNNGMKVNVGIDIINTLSRHYGVRVPLFVDNAEAVTRLEGCGSQVIRLVVREEDQVLRVE